MGTLKEQNARYVWVFFAFNSLLFYSLSFIPVINQADFDWKSFLIARGIWLLIVPIILFIVSGLLTSDQKAGLVFWRRRHALPGHRAFSIHLGSDTRIDAGVIKSRYNPLPNTPEEENALWYKLYKTHGEIPSVKRSHKDFLLGRELTSIAFLFLLIGGISGLFWIEGLNRFYYLSFMILQYITLSYVTMNYARRFVTNVLATESTLP
jgi:hypothetical protein